MNNQSENKNELKIRKLETKISSQKQLLTRIKKYIESNEIKRKRLESEIESLEKELYAKTVSKINRKLSGVGLALQTIDMDALIEIIKINQEKLSNPGEDIRLVQKDGGMDGKDTSVSLPIIEPDRFS